MKGKTTKWEGHRLSDIYEEEFMEQTSLPLLAKQAMNYSCNSTSFGATGAEKGELLARRQDGLGNQDDCGGATTGQADSDKDLVEAGSEEKS
ncbi:unnamed protein product, partial [Amoebophrya sp. A120]|eukprot:GSA120T00004466001.1